VLSPVKAPSPLKEVTPEEIRRIHEGLGHLHVEGVLQAMLRSGYDVTRTQVTEVVNPCALCPLFNHTEKKISRRMKGSKAYGTRFGEQLEHDLTFMPTTGRMCRTRVLSVMEDRYTGTPSFLCIPNKALAYKHLELWSKVYGLGGELGW